MLSYPGHRFDATSAKLIWKTHSKYESQLVEAACINRFPSCNISKGEIRMTPAIATFTTYIAGLHRQLGKTSLQMVMAQLPTLLNLLPSYMVLELSL